MKSTLFKITLISTICTMIFTGCSSKDTKIDNNYTIKSNTQGLTLRQETPTIIFVRPGAKKLAEYEYFMIEPIKVDYKDDSIKKLSKQQIKKLQDYFYSSLSKNLTRKGIKTTNSKKENTMKMSFIISGIKAPNPVANIVSLLAPVALSVGEVTIEGSFRNLETGNLDAIVVNKSKGSNVLNSKPWSTWADIEESFDKWSEGITNSIKP